MGERTLRVLAVDDPAVTAYTNPVTGILKRYGEEVQFDVIAWNQYYSAMMDVFDGKAAYDIIMVAGHLWMCDFVEKGYLEELSYNFEDVLPVIAKEMKLHGKTYLSPSFCDGHIVVYRKDIVKKALGSELPEVITPWQFVEAARKITEKNGKPSIALKADSSEIFTDALPFLRMNGKDVYEGSKAVCNDARIISGLETYCSLKKYALTGSGRFGNEEIALAIRENKVAMATTWSGQMGVVYTDACRAKEKLGFCTFSTAWNVTWSFGIFAGSKNKVEAKKFLDYLRSKEVDKIVGNISGAPVRKSSYMEEGARYPWYGCQLKMFENARALPHMVFAGDKNNVFYREIAEVFAGRKMAEKAMEDAEREINAIG